MCDVTYGKLWQKLCKTPRGVHSLCNGLSGIRHNLKNRQAMTNQREKFETLCFFSLLSIILIDCMQLDIQERTKLKVLCNWVWSAMFIHAEICPNSKHLKSSVNIPISNEFIYFISKKVYLRKKKRNGNSYLIGHAQACVPRCALQN